MYLCMYIHCCGQTFNIKNDGTETLVLAVREIGADISSRGRYTAGYDDDGNLTVSETVKMEPGESKTVSIKVDMKSTKTVDGKLVFTTNDPRIPEMSIVLRAEGIISWDDRDDDGDGVRNADDLCPDEWGDDGYGCPVIIPD